MSQNPDALLYDAFKSGDHDEVVRLLNCATNPAATWLHYACQRGWCDVVKLLVQRHEFDPNTRDTVGRTPLHCACQHLQLDIVEVLISELKCESENVDNLGMTPLHYACKSNCFTIVRCLVSKGGCNPNVVDNNGDTPLHHLCRNTNPHPMCISHLMKMPNFNPNIKNNAGQTPLHVVSPVNIETLIRHGADPDIADNDGNTLLHKACAKGSVECVDYLLKSKLCDPNAKNKAGLTPLQVTPPEYSNIIKILIEHGADPSVVDNDGNTLLHEACTCIHWNPQSIEYLLQSKLCDPNAKNKAGLTPLLVTPPEYSNIIKNLIEHGADPSVVDNDGNTLLHKACTHWEQYYFENQKSCEYLLRSKLCDPNAKNKAGLTPLQVTPLRYSNIIKTLIEHGADPSVVDKDGNTPLHKACCMSGTLYTVRYLLQSAIVNPNCQNDIGLTPLELTFPQNTSIIQELLKYGAKPVGVYKIRSIISKQPLQSLVKVLVVGDPSVGKSTLTAALQKEAFPLLRTLIPAQKVTDVDTKTAGVVPHNFESREYGHTTIYDFAGQRDFYGSHAALMQSVIRSNPPIILLVVNLEESEEFIKQNILYWLSFLENHCISVNGKPHVIIVGSHADVIRSRGEDPDEKSQCLKPDKTIPFPHFVFVGFVTMDCQFSNSPGMTTLRQCLKTSCNVLREKQAVNINSHCFYIYLVDKFRDKIAVAVKQVQAQIKLTNISDDETDIMGFIPGTLHNLINICNELNDRGNIMFLKDTNNLENSWIVIDRAALLTELSGTIFAPIDFKQHKVVTQCTCSTGVVPLSKITAEFPQYNPNMIIGFLSCLEYCHEIADQEILNLITEGHQACVESSHQSSEKERYFLFPALVSLKAPDKVWQNRPDFPHQCGWILQCSNDIAEQFFTSRFLQVLLLRLAFSFALIQEKNTYRNIPALKRKGSIWKNGIFWARDGVETLVEVLPINRAVVVLLRCINESFVKLLELRSQVIQKVLTAAKEFCSRIETTESFVDPREITQYPLKPTPELTLFSLTETSRAVCSINSMPVVVSPTGSIPLRTLLLFEPYAELLVTTTREIFANEDNPDKVPNTLLLRISEQVSENKKTFMEIFKLDQGLPDTTTVYQTLKVWRDGCEGTCKCLKETLDRYSIFAGRNPLETAGVHMGLQGQRTRKTGNSRTTEDDEHHLTQAFEEPKPNYKVPLKSDKPKLCQLQMLKGWEQLAIALGFEAAVINYLNRDYSSDAVRASTQILMKWLDGDSDLDKPITWDTLIGCLSDAGFENMVEDLEEIFQDNPSQQF